jgi:two-component system sensor histidine kinase AlgZ
MLQLLLENAIHHGIDPLPEGGNIDIRLWIHDGRLYISISSPYAELSEAARRDGDTALNNIRLRLHDLYGDNADLNIERDDRSMAVHISHPAFGESSK